MQLQLKVDQGDGPYEVTTNLYVIVQWERKFKRKASDLANGIGMEDIAYMAWHASKLHGVVVPAEFDKFVEKCVSLEVLSEDEAAPFEPAPTDTL
jgi:hypothetical protein